MKSFDATPASSSAFDGSLLALRDSDLLLVLVLS
jgi:hypothetical protein